MYVLVLLSVIYDESLRVFKKRKYSKIQETMSPPSFILVCFLSVLGLTRLLLIKKDDSLNHSAGETLVTKKKCWHEHLTFNGIVAGHVSPDFDIKSI